MQRNSIIAVQTWDGIEFVRITKGEFIMGSRADNELAFSDEKLQHKLKIPYDYWIGRYPVSNSQFGEFVRSTAFETRAELEGWGWVWYARGRRWGKKKGANWKHPLGASRRITDFEEHPVVQVCWYDALAFCDWFTQKSGHHLQKGYRFRLPSEAEWEKSARGTDGREWSWGDIFDASCCNSIEGGRLSTTPVRAYSPQGDSVYGIADMSGNVWEWTQTIWGGEQNIAAFVYPYSFNDGREDQSTGSEVYRIIRGGSFKDDWRGVRCACRDLDLPFYSFCNVGFRLVMAPI